MGGLTPTLHPALDPGETERNFRASAKCVSLHLWSSAKCKDNGAGLGHKCRKAGRHAGWPFFKENGKEEDGLRRKLFPHFQVSVPDHVIVGTCYVVVGIHKAQ